MTSNKLPINSNITECQLFNPSYTNPPVITINLDFNIISPCDSAKNLDVIFQTDIFLDKHILSIVKSCFFQLRDFRRIRPFISKTAAITLANAFVHSRLDFRNSLFYGLPKYSIHRLQKVQNTVAHIISNSSRFCHITPTLKFLYRLPIFYCTKFKTCCVTYRALFLDEPFYLSTLLTHRLNTHSFRSTSFSPLLLPYLNKNLTAFVILLMLHHFSRIIYLVLFALRPLTCHLEQISKLIYLIKLFLLRLSSLYKNHL